MTRPLFSALLSAGLAATLSAGFPPAAVGQSPLLTDPPRLSPPPADESPLLSGPPAVENERAEVPPPPLPSLPPPPENAEDDARWQDLLAAPTTPSERESGERESGYRPVPSENRPTPESYGPLPETSRSLTEQYPITVEPFESARPEYEAPRYDAPRYEAPQYEAPQYEAPQYEAPQYEAPRDYAPSLSERTAPRAEAVSLSNSVWDTTYTSVTGHLVRGEVRLTGNGGTVLAGEGRFSNLTFTPAANGRPARIAGDWVMNGFTGTVAWNLLTADMTNGRPRLEGSWTLTGGPPGTWRRTGSWNGTLAADQNAPPDPTATILAEPSNPAPQSRPAPQAATPRGEIIRRGPFRLFRRRGN